jgi:hypothetical protein
MPGREEVLVAAAPLALRVERGPEPGTLEIHVEGFDPIAVTAARKIILRPEGLGVVLERENLKRKKRPGPM